MTTHKTFCRFRHAICGIEVDVEHDRALPVRGDREHPISRGYLCVKGRALIEQHEDPDRVRSARRRLPDGRFVDVPSETALDEVAARLAGIVARQGPSAVAL